MTIWREGYAEVVRDRDQHRRHREPVEGADEGRQLEQPDRVGRSSAAALTPDAPGRSPRRAPRRAPPRRRSTVGRYVRAQPHERLAGRRGRPRRREPARRAGRAAGRRSGARVRRRDRAAARPTRRPRRSSPPPTISAAVSEQRPGQAAGRRRGARSPDDRHDRAEVRREQLGRTRPAGRSRGCSAISSLPALSIVAVHSPARSASSRRGVEPSATSSYSSRVTPRLSASA